MSKPRRYLREHYAEQTFLDTREEAQEPESVNHELALSAAQADLYLAAKKHPDFSVLRIERRYFHASNALLFRDQNQRHRRLFITTATMANQARETDALLTAPIWHSVAASHQEPLSLLRDSEPAPVL